MHCNNAMQTIFSITMIYNMRIHLDLPILIMILAYSWQLKTKPTIVSLQQSMVRSFARLLSRSNAWYAMHARLWSQYIMRYLHSHMMIMNASAILIVCALWNYHGACMYFLNGYTWALHIVNTCALIIVYVLGTVIRQGYTMTMTHAYTTNIIHAPWSCCEHVTHVYVWP